MKILIINNIQSGFGDGSVYDFVRSFSKNEDEIVIRNILHTTKVNNLLKDAKNFDLVIASGGDNTVSKVSYALAFSDIPVLAYPSGTFNIIGMNLFIPNEVHSLAKMARDLHTMKFDVGEIEIGNKKFGFGSNAGVGYDAQIYKEANPSRKNLGPLAYIGAIIKNFKPKFVDFEINIDGKDIKTSGIGIMILNFSKIGLELSVTHKNRPRDGQLDIVVLKAKNSFSYIPALTAAALDKAIEFNDRSKALEIYQGKSIYVKSSEKLQVHIDGNTKELYTPIKASVLKHAVSYVVDEKALEAYN